MPSDVPVIDASPSPSDLKNYQQAQQTAVEVPGLEGLGGGSSVEPTSTKPAPKAKKDPFETTPSEGPDFKEPMKSIAEAEKDDPWAESQTEEIKEDRYRQLGEDIEEGLEKLGGEEESTEKKEETSTEKEETPTEDDELEKEVQELGPLKAVRKAHKEKLKENRALKKDLETQAKSLSELEEKLKSLESGNGQSKELEERLKQYEEKIKILDYTQSEEFSEAHVKPLTKALENAYSEVEELVVIEGEDQTRKATKEDFLRLVNKDPVEARKEANLKFGEWANDVMDHYRTVRKLEKARQEAVKNADKMAEAAIQRQEEESQRVVQEFNSSYESSMKEIADRMPDLFKERDGDQEGNALLAKNREFVKKAMEAAGKMSPRERARIAAEMHQRVINYPRALLDLKREREENQKLRKQLKEFEESRPDRGGQPTGARKAKVEDDPYEALERLARES